MAISIVFATDCCGSGIDDAGGVLDSGIVHAEESGTNDDVGNERFAIFGLVHWRMTPNAGVTDAYVRGDRPSNCRLFLGT